MSSLTVDEQIRLAIRDVAAAFELPLRRVECVTDRLRRRAVQEMFGDEPRELIAQEVAKEIQKESQRALDALTSSDESNAVIDFPQAAS